MVEGLQSKGFTQINFTFTTCFGEVRATVDPANVIDESEETNNSKIAFLNPVFARNLSAAEGKYTCILCSKEAGLHLKGGEVEFEWNAMKDGYSVWIYVETIGCLEKKSNLRWEIQLCRKGNGSAVYTDEVSARFGESCPNFRYRVQALIYTLDYYIKSDGDYYVKVRLVGSDFETGWSSNEHDSVSLKTRFSSSYHIKSDCGKSSTPSTLKRNDHILAELGEESFFFRVHNRVQQVSRIWIDKRTRMQVFHNRCNHSMELKLETYRFYALAISDICHLLF